MIQGVFGRTLSVHTKVQGPADPTGSKMHVAAPSDTPGALSRNAKPLSLSLAEPSPLMIGTSAVVVVAMPFCDKVGEEGAIGG
jgi:hypothetical protein